MSNPFAFYFAVTKKKVPLYGTVMVVANIKY